jgi:Sulfatase
MPSSSPVRLLRVFLGLLTLTTFAIAQSVYQAIVGNPEFVALNRVTHGDLLLIVFVFNVLPPAVLALFWAVVQRWGPRLAGGFLGLSFFLLLAPFLLELHKRYVSPLTRFHHNTILLLIPLAFAAVIVFRYRSEFERFLLVLSPVIVLFPSLFLWRAGHEVSPAIAPPAAMMQAGTARIEPGPPVFILVLDEFTRAALLDSSGNIDASRFPNFARLARESTWFNNTTANAEATTRAIPVIVTGNFPQGYDPSDAAYPHNLFRLLAPRYNVTIREVETRFCTSPEYRCPDAARVSSKRHLLRSVADLYLLRIAPLSVVLKLEADQLQQERERFHDFLAEIGPRSGDRPVMEFMHHELPHSPYLLTPDGAVHPRSPSSFYHSLAGNREAIEGLRGAYEMQVEFTDRELGEFLDRLKEAGVYDQALVIVTADHGVSWKIDAPGRVLTEATADMIFPIPLFIKLPGQTMPVVSDADVQSIDLLPTIAAVVGVKVPWTVAGRDIYGPNFEPRQKVMVDANDHRFEFPPTFAATLPKTGGP